MADYLEAAQSGFEMLRVSPSIDINEGGITRTPFDSLRFATIVVGDWPCRRRAESKVVKYQLNREVSKYLGEQNTISNKCLYNKTSS